MRISEQITVAVDDAEAGKFESALLHACTAVDATARKLYLNPKVGDRYVQCLRQYYWLIEPMIGAGLNLVETRFPNVPLRTTATPDLAEIIYEVFRCNLAHGDEVPLTFAVTPSHGEFFSQWLLADRELHMPDRVIWALLGVAVFSKANKDESSSGDYYLSLGTERFLIAEWWGREDDFRPIAERFNSVRVKLEGLEVWPRH